MVATYRLFGANIGSHWLSIGTLSTVFIGSYLSMRGGSAQPATTPPINAGSKDEEKFIQEFLQQVEQEDKANKISGKEAH